MRVKSGVLLMGAILIAGWGVSGCATKGFVRHQVADEDVKVQVVSGTAGEALERAKAAHKLAEGKFLYQMVLSDDSVKFPTNGHDLSDEARTRLTDFVSKLKDDNKNVYLEIQGHTDSTGTDAINMRLGQDRAEAVRLFMNQQGVPLNRMATISYGDKSPVAPNDTPEGRSQNRRVVVIVMA
jgi:outer membrane protein OmpA-like peptidoglycan-associated protein